MNEINSAAVVNYDRYDWNSESPYAGLYKDINPLWQLICCERPQKPLTLHPLQIESLLKSGHDVNELWDYLKLIGQYNSTELRWYHSSQIGLILNRAAYGPGEDRGAIMVSPLLSAVSANDFKLVSTLLQYGADVHVRSKLSTTSLHEAVRTGSEDLVKVIIEYGADIEARTRTGGHLGCTPLHFATVNADYTLVDRLIEEGASVRATTAVGWTAVDIAILNRQVTMVDTLLRLSDPVLWAKEVIARIDKQTSDTTNMVQLARHVLKHGIRDTDKNHKRMYAKCLQSVVTRLGPAIIASDRAGRGLVFEVERSLLQLADMRTDIQWPRKFCSACEDFQGQDDGDLSCIFRHSSSFNDMITSARQGCCLCQALVEVYGKSDSGRTGEEQLCRSSEVLLQLKGFSDWKEILVGCDSRVGRLPLLFVNEEVHTAICSTSDLDKYGVGSQRTRALAKAWMQHCIKSHDSCRSTEELMLPTRVIDVGYDQRQPFLVESLGKQARYTTLSYCRGNQGGLCTIRSNYQQHHEEIPLPNIPNTVRDAIEITRSLGIQYLWVDFLCVVQDSEKDVEDQASKMELIFSNATVTIAAQDSPDCLRGCFLPRLWISSAAVPLDLRLPARLNNACGSSQINRIIAMPQIDRSRRYREKSVLDTRGWTMQEQMLSRRILRCWDGEISWDCLEVNCSETNLYHDLPSPQPQQPDGLRWTLLTGKDYWSKKQLDQQEMFQRWRETVLRYSYLCLSHPKDRAIALIGLQNRFAKVLNDTPILGCWRGEYFWHSCLWICSMNPTPRMKQTKIPGVICPSWSWACVSVPVSYDLFLYEVPDPVFLPKVTAWNLHTIRQNSHVIGSISISGGLLRPEDLEKVVDRSQAFNNRLRDDFNRHRANDTDDMSPWEAHFMPPCPRTESAVYATYRDHYCSIPAENIWYLVIVERPFQPPPGSRPGHGCVFPPWSHGRPPSVILMCLEKLSADKMHFRRAGLAEAYDEPEWRSKEKQYCIELF